MQVLIRGILVAVVVGSWGCSPAPERGATVQASVGIAKLAELSSLRTNLGSTPRGFATVNGVALFFSAEHLGLFRSDGTAEGTQLVRDLEPTLDPEEPAPRIVALGDRAYWTQGATLWTSDGTGPGTALVTTFAGPVSELGVYRGALYLGSADGLVQSDGTAAGSRVLAPVTTAGPWRVVADRLYFPCATPGEGGELCVSDGTRAGTTVVADLAPGPASSSPALVGAVGDHLLFSARATGGARSLWSTDGAATVELLAATSGDAVGDVVPAIFAGRAWLPCTTRAAGAELCRTDGTAAGTAVLDAVPGAGSLNPSDPAVAGGRLVFAAHQTDVGTELWTSDGTVAGTALLVDLAPGAGSGVASPRLIPLGDQLLFAAHDASDAAVGLWRTDGTAAGTVEVRQPAPRHDEATPLDLAESVVVGARLVFAADDGVAALEPWVSDGTTAGTHLLKDLRPARSPVELTELRDHHGATYLTARVSPNRDLWRSDGTAAGTAVLQRGTLSELSPAGHWLFFQGGGLWRTDGEAPSHIALPGRASNIHALGDRVVFAATTPSQNRGLWVSDGTEAGTSLTDPIVVNADGLEVANGRLWLSGLDGAHGNELWTGDGSTHAQVVADLRPGPADSHPTGFVALGGATVFAANDGVTGRELWKTDGTAAGTVRIADLLPGAAGSTPDHFLAWNGRAVFSAGEFGAARPWITDGTAAGTFELARATIEDDPGFVAWGNFVFFRALDDHGTELWRSDGTAAGTVRVADLAPGPLSSDPALLRLVAPGGPLVFVAEEPAAGRELWQLTQPTGAPQLLADLAPGPRSSRPTGIGVQGSKLIVVADPGDGYAAFRLDGVGRDATAPVLTCPDVTVVTAEPSAAATFQVTATDDSGVAPTITTDRASGGAFLFGDTTVAAAATDGSNNTARCTFVVHVTDHTQVEPGPDGGPGSMPDAGGNPDDSDGGGCSATGSGGALTSLAALLLLRRKRVVRGARSRRGSRVRG